MLIILMVVMGLIGVGIVIFALIPETQTPTTIPISLVVAPPQDLPNVEIPFVKAGPNKRVCAYLIDTIVVALPNWAVFTFIGTGWGWILPLVYFLLKDALTGQSVGKMLVGLRVVNAQNQPVDFSHGMMRNILLALSGVLGYINKWLVLCSLLIVLVEYFSMTGNKDGQRVGDKIGQTRVQDLKPEISDKTFLFISVVLMMAFIAYYVTMAPKGK